MEANTVMSCLIWVHLLCNKGYLRKQTDEKADGKSHNWQEHFIEKSRNNDQILTFKRWVILWGGMYDHNEAKL